ncbi:MAG: hydrogenase maturation nickel metallochaperone HypA [Nocardioidaceae bacterium]|nr:hydrogenase maturation nickel metallochaperone HypA [Nocardioidaceae bacterium]
MHELAITQSIVDAVTDQTAGATVAAVHVRVGRLSGVLPDAMRFCFEVVEAARLERTWTSASPLQPASTTRWMNGSSRPTGSATTCWPRSIPPTALRSCGPASPAR